MSYEAEHGKWLERHLARRGGERLDALKRGHGFGNQLFVEKIWWPLFGHLAGLHPEFEVKDWRGRSYYVDLMWIVGEMRIAFEIMDYGSHGTDRTKYRSDLNRGLFLQSQNCLVIYISLDELKENPSFVQSMVRNIIAPYLSAINGRTGDVEHSFCKVQRELMQWAVRHNRILRPSQAARELEIHRVTVVKHCRALVEKGKLRAVTNGRSNRIFRYEYLGPLQSPDML